MRALILIPNTSVWAYCIILRHFLFLTEEEGYISHHPANSIGHSNGNHDLTRMTLEVGVLPCTSLSTSVCAV